MHLNERHAYRAIVRASKASEWNRKQEEHFVRGKRKNRYMQSGRSTYQFELLLFLINFINNIKLTYMFNFNNCNKQVFTSN